MMEWIYRHRCKIHALALICNFGLGMFVGYMIVEHEARTYIGTVIKKDYQPSEIKYERRDEWIDGKLKVVKVPERAEEQYSFLLKDVFGSQTTVFVTKEEYRQFEIGDKYRR